MSQGAITESYGEKVFSIRTMREYLSTKAYKSLTATICEGRSLDSSIADEVADAMKTWAISLGATHYTHWFQPLTGATAEKHDAFIMPDREGGALTQFSAKELIKSEPDASSFPSGGIRSTFEARGYTAWDPTSPAFFRKTAIGGTLCIPSVFCSYHGEALDKKTPLMRSIAALSTQVCRLAKLFGMETDGKRAYAELGAEQEYFLVDRNLYNSRLDLIQTGRTLFGAVPAKHQQMSDHYFGIIKRRVIDFMDALDRELWKLGIPAKTRHNEVCPAQFEIAPVFEELNLAVDHNMLIMETLRELADQHDFACLLHEKPFAGVNGSGKHNNWNVLGPDGKNWLAPGSNPQEDARFLTMICVLMKAVDTHAPILRAAVASAGNDHRLGGHEAPPAIISIFLGEQLAEIIESLELSSSSKFGEKGTLEIGVSSLPTLPRDLTDRNRTSPFAFTGNKFEFRALGSNQNCASANIVLNTIVAEAIDELCASIEASMDKGVEFHDALQAALTPLVAKHKRVIFNGDNYTAEWRAEAAKRGLPNITNTPDALEAIISEESRATFEKYGVLSARELESRYEVYRSEYEGVVDIEARCAAVIANTMIIPSAIEYQHELAASLNEAAKAGVTELDGQRARLEKVSSTIESLLRATGSLESALDSESEPLALLATVSEMRTSVDLLESLMPSDLWPMPTYADLMFSI